VVKKKGRSGCDAGPLKAESKNTHALNSATASQSQTLKFQTAHLARRFGLSTTAARIVAQLAFSNGRAA
jgi:hypothetical protein